MKFARRPAGSGKAVMRGDIVTGYYSQLPFIHDRMNHRRLRRDMMARLNGETNKEARPRIPISRCLPRWSQIQRDHRS
jgi:hypothetical protein